MKKLTLYSITIALFVIYSCGTNKSKQEEETSEESTTTAEVAEAKKSVYFESPSDGEVVGTTFKVVMGLEGMIVEPAGEVKEGYGHHHLLINQTGWPEGEIIPPSDTTIHYGKGQTETELTLEPGQYTISMQFADGVHRSYGPSMAASINITVQ